MSNKIYTEEDMKAYKHQITVEKERADEILRDGLMERELLQGKIRGLETALIIVMENIGG